MKLGLAGILLSIAAVIGLFYALDLLPPKQIRMAAGSPGSAYHAIASRYRALLARDGITLEIVESAGSVENAALLVDETNPVDVALLQGGIEPESGDDAPQIEALASVFIEPVFIFQRPEMGRTADPTDWQGRRVAIGPEGSGTRAAMLRTLRELETPLPPDTLVPLGGQAAADAVLAGEIDAAVFIAPVTAPYLRPLLGSTDVRLAEIRDVDALERRLAFVEVVEVPRGGFDYANQVPAEPVKLPALVARLAAQPDLHPALVDRLVRAAQRIHAEQDILTSEGRFPTARHATLPMNPQAASLLESAPSALDRYLPFWVVAQINRVAVLLLPIIFLLLPLLRALPGLYQWSMHKRIYRHYDTVLAIEAEALETDEPGHLDALVERLDGIEEETRHLKVPTRYGEYLYTLRVHLNLVRERIEKRRHGLADQPA
jgi:TRAP-type uncharacterized transport system substrate-binding protein